MGCNTDGFKVSGVIGGIGNYRGIIGGNLNNRGENRGIPLKPGANSLHGRYTASKFALCTP
jgi:hypothetical protein